MRFFALALVLVLVSACAASPPWEKVNKQQQLEAYTNKGQGYLNLGETQQALADFRKALAINGKYAPALHGTALALAAQDELALAEEFFYKALKASPPSLVSQVQLDLAGFYYQQQNYPQALHFLQLASKDIYHPNRGLVFINLGYTQIKLNQPVKAIESFNLALKLNPSQHWVSNELLTLYVAEHLWQQAEAEWLNLKTTQAYTAASLPLALQAVTQTNNQQEINYLNLLMSTQHK